jgi:hypothetical protein
MHPCPKVEAKVKVEDHQELEIKHLNKGIKIWNNTKFLHSSNAIIMSMKPRRRWLILEGTWCLQCNDGTTLQRNCKRSFMARNKKMCENKWNGLNFDYEKLSNYHKGIGHHTSSFKLIVEKCNKFHLPQANSTKKTMK